MWINERETQQKFLIMNLRKKNNVILGYMWLTKNNPMINWTKGTVRLKGTPVSQHNDLTIVEQRYLLQYLNAVERDKSGLAT